MKSYRFTILWKRLVFISKAFTIAKVWEWLKIWICKSLNTSFQSINCLFAVFITANSFQTIWCLLLIVKRHCCQSFRVVPTLCYVIMKHRGSCCDSFPIERPTKTRNGPRRSLKAVTRVERVLGSAENFLTPERFRIDPSDFASFIVRNLQTKTHLSVIWFSCLTVNIGWPVFKSFVCSFWLLFGSEVFFSDYPS